MPEFMYQVQDINNQTKTGSINAPSKDEAATALKDQGLTIISLKEQSQAVTAFSKISGHISVLDKANLCRYLGTMIGAGLPLAEAIDTIAKDTRSPTLKQLLNNLQRGLQQGEPLSDLFAKYPQHFDSVFLAIVKAGEQSGTLSRSFQYLENQLMDNHSLSQKVKGALIYPAVIITTMFGVGAILIIFVVPQIAQVFLKTKLPVPKLTVMVLQFGLTLNKNLPLIGMTLLLIAGLLIILLRTRFGRTSLLGFLKRLPVVSHLFETLDLARFARTLATLMQSGVPITESINVAISTLSHFKFFRLRQDLPVDIKKGESISSILRRHPEVPSMMTSMVATGEKTGTTDKILFQVASFYEQELENAIKNFTAILEPIIMLIIGIGVGGMVLSVIAPIYSLVSSLQTVK